MGADDDIDETLFQVFQNCSLLSFWLEPGEGLHPRREKNQTILEGVQMLVS